eukprot:CAMPEP_0114575960 /NCGR_PEP_ID=MMETSP0125-20121206/770_1 /TAXON_ID=485358 ORGANISM="Aristerostoma sp., Strain ATCC 50986" /NCGR_SAMPLE_ID=MMETSP0125 /ASSEMBLY_ACC=CAM_ASM_000245 /LENGTH=138 /DNA_ID=CAMNT_0001764093 /DNA_START=1581 /DNA_END=1997 /DNA_ORIENTATION=-
MDGDVNASPAYAVSRNGIGLGLTVSHKLSKMLNHEEQGITVNSVEGSGSTFSLNISTKLQLKPKTLETHDFNTSSMVESSILVDKKLSHYIEYDLTNPMKSMKEVVLNSTSQVFNDDKKDSSNVPILNSLKPGAARSD